MAEDEFKPDEEYQFSDLESPDVYTPPEELGASNAANIQRKVMMLVLLIMIAVGVYKVLGIFKKTKTVELPEVAQIAVPQPPVELPPVQVMGADGSLSREDSVRLNNELAGLRSSMISIDTKLAQVNTMLEKVSILSREQDKRLNRQQGLIKGLVAEREKPKVVKKQQLKRKVYDVQALVPGRAWLRGPGGENLTVSRGDKLEGYGVVRLVDADNGRVVMTSGDILYFNPSDR